MSSHGSYPEESRQSVSVAPPLCTQPGFEGLEGLTSPEKTFSHSIYLFHTPSFTHSTLLPLLNCRLPPKPCRCCKQNQTAKLQTSLDIPGVQFSPWHLLLTHKPGLLLCYSPRCSIPLKTTQSGQEECTVMYFLRDTFELLSVEDFLHLQLHKASYGRAEDKRVSLKKGNF